MLPESSVSDGSNHPFRVLLTSLRQSNSFSQQSVIKILEVDTCYHFGFTPVLNVWRPGAKSWKEDYIFIYCEARYRRNLHFSRLQLCRVWRKTCTMDVEKLVGFG